MYLALDIETTGLSPYTDYVLELAAVMLDDDLHELARIDGVVTVDERHLQKMDDYVRHMHLGTGLVRLDDVGHLSVVPSEGQIVWPHHGDMHDALEDFVATGVRAVASATYRVPHAYLLGASVHFDRQFLPEGVTSLLSHRHLDVSSLKLALRDAVDWPVAGAFGPTHRAMADTLHAIECARRVRALADDVAAAAAKK